MNFRTSFFRSFAIGVATIVAGAGLLTGAQDPPQAAVQPPDTPVWSPQQLDNLIAPIALYPDPLLSQVLVASTYPLEIVEAQQWLQNNSSLTGADLIAAAEQQTWDASVQALVAFPDVLAKLNQDIRWTNDVGNAFLAQQADVMSAVQRMRASAKANGKLTSSPQQVVTTETANGQSSIEIQPASPDVVYVPTYDPGYVWGPPAWGAYPPLVYPAFGFGFGPAWNVGLCFAPWGGWGGWGWGPNWFGGGIVVNNVFFHHFGFRSRPGWGNGSRTNLWAHDPTHRLGVPYPNRQLSGQFGTASRMNAQGMINSQRMGMGNSFNPSRGGANRQAFPGMTPGARPNVGHPGMQGGNPGPMRSIQPAQRPSMPAVPRAVSPGFGGAGRSFGGGGGFRGFGGGGGGGGFRGGFGGGGGGFRGGFGGGGGGGFRGGFGGGGGRMGGGGGRR